MAANAGDGLIGPEMRVRRQPCLGCGERIDVSAVIGGGAMVAPKPDDFAVCNRCGEVMRWTTFGSQMQLRPLTPPEAEIARKHSGIRAVSTAARTRAENPR